MDGVARNEGVILAPAIEIDGSEPTFEQVIPELTRLAFRIAYSVLRDRSDAEDVAQEALLRSYTRLSTLRDQRRLRSWLVRIAWRLALDRRRSDRRREQRERATSSPGAADPVSSHEELRAQLAEALDRLPTRLRTVLVLAVIHGHALGQVAELLGIPVGTAKTRLRQAKLRLGEMLR